MNLDGNSLISSFAVSTVGLGFFMYGKKQGRAPQIAFGLICLVYPYFISSPLIMFGVFFALLGLMYFALRLGW